ncbi:Alpha/Beta hydrolase protein [Gloeopeniophorella convolvens]|nr:Alpha/Beta hydrolase protein [Gloeopeniophorella convolvens]
MSNIDQPAADAFAPLTLRQKFQLLPFRLFEPFAVFFGALFSTEGRSWRRAKHLAELRYNFGRKWEVQTLKSYLGTTTAQAYEAWALATGQEALTDDLAEGARIHWIGPRHNTENDRVLLYFHGGGFVVPGHAGFFSFLKALQDDVKNTVGDIGIAFLNYSLAPEAPFPTQVRQANAAITYLLERGIAPSHIIVAGSSAGGNLTLGLGAHLLHPLASIPAPPALSEPLAGALLDSPWATFNTYALSHKRNDALDMVPSSAYAFLAQQIGPGITPELRDYVEPGTAPASWWEGLDRVYGRVLVTAGENEALFDQIIDLKGKLELHVRDTSTFVEPGGVHMNAMDAFWAGEGRSDQEFHKMVSWISETFKA